MLHSWSHVPMYLPGQLRTFPCLQRFQLPPTSAIMHPTTHTNSYSAIYKINANKNRFSFDIEFNGKCFKPKEEFCRIWCRKNSRHIFTKVWALQLLTQLFPRFFEKFDSSLSMTFENIENELASRRKIFILHLLIFCCSNFKLEIGVEGGAAVGHAFFRGIQIISVISDRIWHLSTWREHNMHYI